MELFDPIIDSCEVGLRKPDHAIYSLTCERMGLATNDCLFLDDHPGNVAAALAVGLDALEVGEDFEAVARTVRDRL